MTSWWQSISIEAMRSINFWSQVGIAFCALLTGFLVVLAILATVRIGTLEAARQGELEEDVSTAQRRLAEIEEQQQPRRLQGDAAAAFLSALEGNPPGVIFIQAALGEPTSFANDIADLLRQRGWTIEALNAVFFTADIAGVELIVQDQEAAPQFAGALQRAFAAAGFEARGSVDPNRAPNSLTLRVGRKPDPQ